LEGETETEPPATGETAPTLLSMEPLVALLDDHVSCDGVPVVTVVGDKDREHEGAGETHADVVKDGEMVPRPVPTGFVAYARE
jgi:hypothetical protein